VRIELSKRSCLARVLVVFCGPWMKRAAVDQRFPRLFVLQIVLHIGMGIHRAWLLKLWRVTTRRCLPSGLLDLLHRLVICVLPILLQLGGHRQLRA
jgi:hypothetical protein